MKRALVTGISGQDGRLLAPLLQSKGYEVFGLLNGQRRVEWDRVKNELPQINLIGGDLADYASLCEVLDIVKPDEIYNLGALSFVGNSFSQPELFAHVTGLGPLRLLEAVRKMGLTDKSKIFQASSSEMFGKVRETPQCESTPFHPRSPYAAAKVFAHQISVNYRESYGVKVSCGIMFNHESEFRGHEFVTRKITNGVAKILLGVEDSIVLGALNPRRDWGYAGDYVEAMWLMLQQEVADDFVIATGKTHSVSEFLNKTFELAEIEDGASRYVNFDASLLRPAEVNLLVGDATKASEILDWRPKTSFEEMIRRMLANDIRINAKAFNKPLPSIDIFRESF